jgi:hypothetical protein
VIPGFALFHLGEESGPPAAEVGAGPPAELHPTPEGDMNGMRSEFSDERPE